MGYGHNANGCRSVSKEAWEASIERECLVAIKEGLEMRDKYGKPLAGPNRHVDPNAAGRNIKGKRPMDKLDEGRARHSNTSKGYGRKN